MGAAMHPDGGGERLFRQFGPHAAAAQLPEGVGPDWAVVEEYLDQQRAGMEGNRERAVRDVATEDLTRNRLESLAGPHDASRALAAASSPWRKPHCIRPAMHPA